VPITISFAVEMLAEPPPIPSGKIRIRYSNDGAHNWGDWRAKDPGSVGSFLTELVWRRLGVCRHRVWEFEDTSPYPGAVIAAEIQAESQ